MIPLSINDVTDGWLSEVLGAKVSNIEIDQIGQGIGLMGDIFRVRIDYAESTMAPTSVVVKLPSSAEENRIQGVQLGMFEAEIRFYKELAPKVSVGLPKIYHAEIKPGTADFVLVMEDLSHLTMVDQSEGMTPEQAHAAVTVLANIHTAWWDNAQTQELDWIPTMIGPRIEFVDQMLVDIFPVFAEGFSKYLPAGGIEIYEQFAGNYQKINQTLAARSPWTIAHQDFRVENMMFGDPGSGEVVVLDWQGIGRGPGVYDLAYILGGSMDIELRREHEDSLVRTYHDQLIASGVTDYTFAQAWDDYGHAHLMGGLATSMVTGGSMDLSNERGLQLIASMSERHVTAALDHDGAQRLAAII
jgi:hypothetical protein